MTKGRRQRAVEQRITLLTRVTGALTVIDDIHNISGPESVAILNLLNDFMGAHLIDIKLDAPLEHSLHDVLRRFVVASDGQRIEALDPSYSISRLWQNMILLLPQVRAVVIGAPLPAEDLHDLGDINKIIDSRLAYDDMRHDPLAVALRGEHVK